MPELWLVCEGEKGSVDVAILKPVLSTILAAEIVVEPAGGDSQLSTVARFLEDQRGGRAAYVKDRDYRPREAAEVALQERSPEFLLRRHSIENYLLPPQIVLRAFTQLRQRFERQARGRVPQWLSALPADAEQVADALRECARRRTAEQACFLATHRFWDALPTTVGQIQKRHPTKPTAGDLSQPGLWREALCQEIDRVRDAAEQTSLVRAVSTRKRDTTFRQGLCRDYSQSILVTDGILGRLSWPRSAEGIPPVAMWTRVPAYLTTIFARNSFRLPSRSTKKTGTFLGGTIFAI